MENKIKCPNCGENIDVNQVFAHQTEEKYKAQILAERKRLQSEQEKRNAEFLAKEQSFEEKKKRQNEIFQERLDREKKNLRLELMDSLRKDYDAQMKAQQEELNEKSKVISSLKGKEIEMEKLKRSMKEKEQNLELEFEKRIIKERNEYEEQIAKREQERAKLKLDESEMRLREKDKVVDDMRKQLEEMKRKMEQGSMQLQGEVQELAIEEYLSANFPFDKIEEIKKGARGADCLQIVNDGHVQNCGTIYYESKRTKNFSEQWIEKFKADMLDKGADIGVLVTQTMPSDMEMLGERNGIWVCTFEEFKGIAYLLRHTVIRLHHERSSQLNKGDKMTLLYDFLTGNEFRMQVEAIVEGFRTMKDDLDRERRAMERLWKQREKQLEKVILNTTLMHASIKGIAGNAIQKIDYLELPGGSEED